MHICCLAESWMKTTDTTLMFARQKGRYVCGWLVLTCVFMPGYIPNYAVTT